MSQADFRGEVAEGADKCDPEGISYAIGSLTEILTDQFELEARSSEGIRVQRG